MHRSNIPKCFDAKCKRPWNNVYRTRSKFCPFRCIYVRALIEDNLSINRKAGLRAGKLRPFPCMSDCQSMGLSVCIKIDYWGVSMITCKRVRITKGQIWKADGMLSLPQQIHLKFSHSCCDATTEEFDCQDRCLKKRQEETADHTDRPENSHRLRIGLSSSWNALIDVVKQNCFAVSVFLKRQDNLLKIWIF